MISETKDINQLLSHLPSRLVSAELPGYNTHYNAINTTMNNMPIQLC